MATKKKAVKKKKVEATPEPGAPKVNKPEEEKPKAQDVKKSKLGIAPVELGLVRYADDFKTIYDKIAEIKGGKYPGKLPETADPIENISYLRDTVNEIASGVGLDILKTPVRIRIFVELKNIGSLINEAIKKL